MSNLDLVSIRLVKDKEFMSDIPFRGANDVAKFMGEKMRELDREVCCVVNFTTKFQPINMSVVSVGSINSSVVHPREVFKTAILSNAANILLLHNHPSGVVSPSEADIEITDRLLQASEIMGIRLLDHIIVGRDSKYYSFAENYVLDFNRCQSFATDVSDLDRSLFVAENSRELQTVKEESVGACTGAESVNKVDSVGSYMESQINRALRRRGR
jgi:DNA repair protein RadC